MFVHFLRLRYFLSSYTRDALQNTGRYLDAWIILPDNANNSNTSLTVLSNVYISIKRLVIRYGGGVTLSNVVDDLKSK